MTQFAFEVPHAHLEDFSDLQDFHLALSVHCYKTKYQSFYLNQALLGNKPIWLDNSFNETGKPDDPLTLSKYLHQLCADKVFCPDSMDWNKYDLAKAFNDMIRFTSYDNIIVVVKNEEERDWLASIGARHFAIPFRYRLHKTYNELSWCKDYHFLGMNRIDEIQTLKPPTMDTSMPIRMALYNLTLSKWIIRGQPRYWHKDMPDYYSLVLTSEQIDLARNNILRLKEACL